MSKLISLTYCGMEGSGRTVSLAKQDATRKIEAALEGSYMPSVLAAGDDMAVMWREPCGWYYGFIRNGQIGGFSWHKDRDECERTVRRHLGRNATDYRTCFSDSGVHPIVLNERDRREIAGECEWQRKYQAARAAGLDDQNAMHFVSGFTNFMTQPIPDSLRAA